MNEKVYKKCLDCSKNDKNKILNDYKVILFVN
jgi:hypothetical protein